MLPSDLISMSLEEAEKTSFVHGKVVRVDRVTGLIDVDIDGTEYNNIPKHYHCQDGTRASGFKAFHAGDVVLIKNSAPNDPIAVSNLLVVGFADGYPRMCTRRLVMFSVFDGNPSYYYSGANHVIWDIDAEEIVIGPCSLVALQTAGFIEEIAPDIIMRGDIISASGFILDYTELPSYSANANVQQPIAPDMDSLDNQLIFSGSMPDWDDTASGSAGPIDLTGSDSCYLDGVSPSSLSSSKSAGLDGEYTTREIEDFLVGYDPQPDYYVKTYEFTETMTGTFESASCLARLYYLDQEQSTPGDPVPKAWAGGFMVSSTSFTNSKTKTGGTRWVNSGSLFSSSINDRYRTTVQDDESSTDLEFYSPLGLLKEMSINSTADKTTYAWGSSNSTVTSENIVSESVSAEINAFSAVTNWESVKEDGTSFYEQIACAVYVLSGTLITTVNGETSSTEAIDPAVNVSIDIYTPDEYSAYNAFESDNIAALASAITTALKNSDGGTQVATTFFRGPIL